MQNPVIRFSLSVLSKPQNKTNQNKTNSKKDFSNVLEIRVWFPVKTKKYLKLNYRFLLFGIKNNGTSPEGH